MTHSLWNSLSRGALVTLLLATAPVTFGGEPAASTHEGELIGQLVVTAPREHQLIGHIVVTASRFTPAAFADLGHMTVTARRDTVLAHSDTPRARRVSF